MSTQPVTENAARQRFELVEQGETAFADYRREGDVLHIHHVEAPNALRGTGAAGRLMAGMMDLVRAGGLKVTPHCGYAVSWLKRHKEWADLVV